MSLLRVGKAYLPCKKALPSVRLVGERPFTLRFSP